MLIPFPAAVAAKLGQSTLPFAFGQMRSFTGPTVSGLGGDGLGDGIRAIDGGSIARTGRDLASEAGISWRTVHTAREIRGEAGSGPKGAGFQTFPTASAPPVGGGSRNTSGFSTGVLHGGHGGGSSGSGSDTLTTSDTMVGIDCTERNGVGVVSWIGLERAREGQFLCGSEDPQSALSQKTRHGIGFTRGTREKDHLERSHYRLDGLSESREP